jgi:YidC/Oxa1 family membrane protein insertase
MISSALGGTGSVLMGTENSFVHLIGEIFHPVFVVIATVLAAIYSVVPNYAIAIALLTVLIMALLTPLTVKSTKSMIAMQALQPEIKRLQQKYKGPENRQLLSEELMRLYKERGVNPAGSCLPLFLQMPFLLVLYDVIRGLSNTVTVNGQVHAEPRYIPHSSKMYQDLVASHGAMNAFGMNLALKPFSHHANWYDYIPYFALVIAAVVLQFIQMNQMTKRNPAAAQANPQMQRMQKIMPIFFAYIYFLIPAAVVIYMIVSTAIRIGTQDILFRTGIVQPAGERVIPGSGKRSPPKATSPGKAAGVIDVKSDTKSGGAKPSGAGSDAGTPDTAGSETSSRNGSTNGTSNGARRPPAKGTPNRSGSQSRRPTSGKSSNSGSTGASTSQNGNTDSATSPKAHPRAKNKRTRKAR